jgi:archaellum component FlaG (FlaF/FlaG flagellin family)
MNSVTSTLKQMSITKITKIITLLFFLVILNSAIARANIGVSPGVLVFEKMLRDGFQQRTLTITSLSNISTVVVEKYGYISEWINITNSTFNITSKNPYYLRVIIKTPSDIATGNYTGYLLIKKIPTPGETNTTASAVIMSVKIPITVEVIGEEIKSCSANSFSIINSEIGKNTKMVFYIKNTGNVRLSPRINYLIWDKEQTRIITNNTVIGDEILPSLEANLEVEVLTNNLSLGQYWIDISIPDCGISKLLTFDILEKGALSTSGRLLRIENPVWVNAGQTISIKAIFENNGQQDVNAKFKGKIELDDVIIQPLDSEELLVKQGETTSFEMFFTPKQEGRYIIRGVVYYASKKTEETFSILNVKPKQGFNWLLVIYIIIILIIILLLAIIKKKRKRKFRYVYRFR